jgi:hypothetical protein
MGGNTKLNLGVVGYEDGNWIGVFLNSEEW